MTSGNKEWYELKSVGENKNYGLKKNGIDLTKT